jgi:hypothetical protein
MATRPALKRASRGRASLAETWALTGREAMSLALTQGRFDRQIEVYTDSLRDELQDSIKRSEAAMKREMAKLQGMLEAVLKPSAGVAGSSGSRAASSPQRAALRPASSKHEGVSTGPGADRGVEARVTHRGEGNA